MFCPVEHRNLWVPHGRNISGILYVGSNIKQHKVKNSCIGLPLTVPFLKVIDYRRGGGVNVGGILVL